MRGRAGDLVTAAGARKRELADVKNYLSGNFVIGLETQGGLATPALQHEAAGPARQLPGDLHGAIRAVQPAQIQAAAAKYLAPQDAGIVVVGDASQIGKTLEKFGKVSGRESRMMKLISSRERYRCGLFG